ncbi:hypothetical protein [Aeromonas veronii]|uniref:hypothetical protein n=1 Tax=Aeromonas veronii TaxID=654 RepID=UPI0040556455
MIATSFQALNLKREINTDLMELEHHFKLWSIDFALKHAKLNAEMHQVTDMDTAGKEFYYDFNRALIENVQKPIYIKSTLIMLFSVLDVSLHKIGAFLYEVKNGQNTYQGKNGCGLRKSYEFFKSNFNISLDAVDQNSWMLLNDVNTVRNCIVHAGSDITYLSEKNREAMQKLPKKYEGISISTYGKVNLTYEFIVDVHSALKDLLTQLSSDCIEPYLLKNQRIPNT